MKILKLAPIALLACTIAVPINAQVLQYTLTGNDSGGAPEYASFQIDQFPTILSNNYALGEGFRVKFIPGTFHYDVGPQYLSYLQDIEFASGDAGGGFFTLFPTDATGAMGTIINISGQKLYNGLESAPMLVTGDFTVYDSFDGSPLSLSIAAVPEPVSWMTIILGVGVMGTALRLRSKTRTRLLPSV